LILPYRSSSSELIANGRGSLLKSVLAVR
jgi:hypothetical protein